MQVTTSTSINRNDGAKRSNDSLRNMMRRLLLDVSSSEQVTSTAPSATGSPGSPMTYTAGRDEAHLG
jgi:hypothetical protein